MSRLQHTARIAAVPLALAGAMACWLWLQSSVSAGGGGGFQQKTSFNPTAAYACVDGEWLFRINRIPSVDHAPAGIFVEWANGASMVVPRVDYGGGLASYATNSHLDSRVVHAEAVTTSAWGSELKLLQGPCGGVLGITDSGSPAEENREIPFVPAGAAYPALAAAGFGAAHLIRRAASRRRDA